MAVNGELHAIAHQGFSLSSQTDGFGWTVAGYCVLSAQIRHCPSKPADARQNTPLSAKHTNNRRFHVLVIVFQ